MNCPACKAALVVVEHEAIEVDWCLECRGLWFDEGELELLGEKAGRVLDVEDLGRDQRGEMAPGERRCPRCPKKMERLQLDVQVDELVEVDQCRDHGFWLDQGELGRIMRRLQRTQDSDEGLVLEFLGETFEHTGTSSEIQPEGRNP